MTSMGIFSVEGPWTSSLKDRTSVRPILELLEDVGRVPFIHKDVTTVDGALDMIRRWPQKQYAPYRVGYFAFHGEPGSILIGRTAVTIEELADELRGGCRGRTIYFGACAVIDVPDRRLAQFRRDTGARCVAGYLEDVDWIEAAAFDLQVLAALTWYRRIDAVEAWLDKGYRAAARRLGFRLHWR